MRQRWRIHPRLPPAAGKRNSGRDRLRCNPAVRRIHIKYTPRPHVRIRLGHRTLRALLDTGSEVSLVNARTARYARTLGVVPIQEEIQVHRLADGTAAVTPGGVNLPIDLQGQQLQHTFRILPTLDSPMLVGTDLWARLQLTLPPPPMNTIPTNSSCAAAAGLVPRSPAEDQKLKTFLRQELAQFERIRGPTSRDEHVIRLKTGASPIKQRYRPRNPAMQKVIDDEVRAMEAEGVIEPSTSAWSSPVVIVRASHVSASILGKSMT